MAFEYTWEKNNCLCTFNKDLCLQDLLDSSNYLIGHPKFDTIRFMIYDLRKVDNYKQVENDIMIISKIDIGASRWNGNIRMACIVGTDTQAEVLIKEYIKLMRVTPWKITICKTMDAAVNWCKDT